MKHKALCGWRGWVYWLKLRFICSIRWMRGTAEGHGWNACSGDRSRWSEEHLLSVASRGVRLLAKNVNNYSLYSMFYIITIHQQSFCHSDSIVTDCSNLMLNVDTLKKWVKYQYILWTTVNSYHKAMLFSISGLWANKQTNTDLHIAEVVRWRSVEAQSKSSSSNMRWNEQCQ